MLDMVCWSPNENQVWKIIFTFGRATCKLSMTDTEFSIGLLLKSIVSSSVKCKKSSAIKLARSLSRRFSVFILLSLYSEGGNWVSWFTLRSRASTVSVRSLRAKTRSIRQTHGPPTFSQNIFTHFKSSEADRKTFFTSLDWVSCRSDRTVAIFEHSNQQTTSTKLLMTLTWFGLPWFLSHLGTLNTVLLAAWSMLHEDLTETCDQKHHTCFRIPEYLHTNIWSAVSVIPSFFSLEQTC